MMKTMKSGKDKRANFYDQFTLEIMPFIKNFNPIFVH